MSTEPALASLQPLRPSSNGRLPDFFIVGHPKCGTTALYEMLSSHPQIYMSDVKETQFFSRDMRIGAPRAELPDTLEEYRALFAAARPDQRIGEASPSYLRSPTAASAIAELQPAARIIAIFREPASFLRSLHLQFVQGVIETEYDLRTALSLEEPRRRGEGMPRYSHWPRALLYSEHVRYAAQLRRYYAVFPPEQVLVLIYDDFRDDNEATVRAVLRFLAVDDASPIAVRAANPTVSPRSQPLHELMHTLSVGRGPVSFAAKAAVKTLTPQRLRRGVLAAIRRRFVYRSAPPPDEGLMIELRRRFKEEVVALSECVGRDLVGLWGYDEVD